MNMFVTHACRLGVVIALASVVAACGGGGGDVSPAVGAGTAVTPAISPTPNANPVSSQALAPYQGTWLGLCEKPTSSSSALTYSSQEMLVFGQTSGTGSTSTINSTRYYANANCSGSAAATVTNTASVLTPAGTTSIAGLTAIKIDVVSPAGTSTFSGPAAAVGLNISGAPAIVITLGTGVNQSPIYYPLTQLAETGKSLISTISASNTFEVGDDASLDTEGYPNKFVASTIGLYTKQ